MWITLVIVLCATWFTICGAVDNFGHVFSSTHKLTKLLEAERDAVHLMKRYITTQRYNIANLKTAQEQFPEEDLGSVEHPVNTLELIHRFVIQWKNIYAIVFNTTDHGAYHKEIKKGSQGLKPHPRDLHGSYKSLVHLQNVYKLDPGAVAKGKIQGPKIIQGCVKIQGSGNFQSRTSQPLDEADCYYLAQAAIDYERYKEALEWIQLGTDKIESEEEYRRRDRDVQDMEDLLEEYGESFTKPHFENFLKNAIKKLEGHEWLKHAMKTAKNSVKVKKSKPSGPDPKVNITVQGPRMGMDDLNIDDLQKYVTETAQQKQKEEQEIEEYQQTEIAHLCRGETGRKRDTTLVCRYRAPNVPYNVWKEEVMNADPHITMIYDFITDAEIKHVQNLSEEKLKRATTVARVYDERVQCSCWHEDSNSTTFYKLSLRVSLVTGLDCMNWAEMWQVGQYGIGGRYGVHFDHDKHFQFREVRGKFMGDRLATFMLYMSNVEAGGFTVFPLIDVYVKPVKGAAVLWYNYTEEGEGDSRTLHASCPVLLGHKWVANKWIHMYGNELNRPCNSHA